jgi:hypothetical protein
MKKMKLSIIGFAGLLLVAGCGSDSGVNSSSNATSNQMNQDESSDQPISSPLIFSLSPNSSVPYACQEIFQRGTLCTLDILYENTGNEVFNYDLSVRAIDDRGRTFAPQNDPSVPQITTGGASFINPGEQLMWSMEFSVSPGTRLTSVEIFQSMKLVAAVPIDLQG